MDSQSKGARSSEPGEPAPEPVDLLFEEFLDVQAHGRAPNIEGLCARAGAGALELRQRVATYHSLASLAGVVKAAQAPAPDEAGGEGERIGRFHVRRPLGEGGLSSVYLVWDPELDREVALKLLDRGARLSGRLRSWVLNEARSLARLEHPGVVRVLEVDHADDVDFVVMERVEGPSLADVIEELKALTLAETDPRRAAANTTTATQACVGPTAARAATCAAANRLIPISQRVRLLARIARALAYCHDRGVLHRDVKPANVLLRGEEPVLIDFGLAHLEQARESDIDITGKLVGTPAYVAPEQVEAGRTGTDPQSDQFSLCVLAYELFALQNPFAQGSRTLTLDSIARAQPRALRRAEPRVSPDLELVVHHGLERVPGERYPSIAHLADDLEACLAHRPVAVSAPSLAQLGRLWMRRNRRVLVIAAIALIVVGSALTGNALRELSGRRQELRDLLARIQPESCQEPADFEDALEHIKEVTYAARELERSSLAALCFDAFEPEVMRTAERWSLRLGQTLRARLGEPGESGTARSESQPEWERWSRLVRQEERLCPASTHNRAWRELERVTLAPGMPGTLHAFRYASPEGRGYSTLRRVNFAELLPLGVYRLQWVADSDASLVGEADFDVQALAPPQVLAIRAPDAALCGRMRSVPKGGCTVRSRDGESAVTVSLPGFRILPEPMRWSDLIPYLDATGDLLEPAERGVVPLQEYAGVSWEQAQRIARWFGMRLPTDLELYYAFEIAHLVQIPSRPGTGAGEWVAGQGFAGLDTRCYYSYASLASSVVAPSERLASFTPSGSVVPPPDESRPALPTNFRRLSIMRMACSVESLSWEEELAGPRVSATR